LCDSATMTFYAGEVSLTCGHVRMIAPRIVFASGTESAPFVLVVPGKLRRRYQGSLSIAAKDNELFAVVEMDLETAVASIVAAEVPASTLFEALKAQAVVTRSFLVASHARHTGSAFCDTTHCQFLRSPPPPDSAASRATRSTKGLVLAWHGKAFPAMYSAACGGRTRTLPQNAQLPAAYPYYAVECRYCLRHPKASGSAGHGIGLCQRGSAGIAGEGSTFREILSHYFPNTELLQLEAR